ncbi:MAG: sodium:alanine symporter family protein [Clostridia bacterium]|nr:sodium:alanine symporter family protein [Clostridia bacterium]
MFQKLVQVTEVLWGVPLTIFVVVAGIYLSYCCKFCQFTKIKSIWKNTLGNRQKTESDKKTFSTVLAGTIGSGNVVGIATAIAVGGPGAIFWMWLIALISMTTKLVEVTLSVKYRKKDQNGGYVGGPMYYIREIFGKFGKILAVVYSIGLLVLVICDAGFVQVNTLATSINETFNIPLVVIGVVLVALSIFIINQGFEKTSGLLKKLVPIMSVIYLIAAMVIILLNIKELPSSLAMIFKYAFSPAPVVGGFAGATVSAAISRGAARGIFANEAGMGTSATVYASGKEQNPLKQGLWGVVEVAIVSFGICTLTALLVMTSGAWSSGETGAVLVLRAFESVYGDIGKYVMCVTLVLFAYSTFLGFYVEYKTTVAYIFGEKSLKYLKWFYYVPIVFATLMPIEAIWSLADMAVGFIVVPNIISLIVLSKKFKAVFRDNEGIL